MISIYKLYPKLPNFTSYKKFLSKAKEDDLLDIEIKDQLNDILDETETIDNIINNKVLNNNDQEIVSLFIDQLFLDIDNQGINEITNYLNLNESHKQFQEIIQTVQKRIISENIKDNLYNPNVKELNEITNEMIQQEVNKRNLNTKSNTKKVSTKQTSKSQQSQSNKNSNNSNSSNSSNDTSKKLSEKQVQQLANAWYDSYNKYNNYKSTKATAQKIRNGQTTFKKELSVQQKKQVKQASNDMNNAVQNAIKINRQKQQNKQKAQQFSNKISNIFSIQEKFTENLVAEIDTNTGNVNLDTENTDNEYLLYFLNSEDNKDKTQSNFSRFGIRQLQLLQNGIFKRFNENKSIMYLANNMKQYLQYIISLNLSKQDITKIENILFKLQKQYPQSEQISELQQYFNNELKKEYMSIGDINNMINNLQKNTHTIQSSKPIKQSMIQKFINNVLNTDLDTQMLSFNAIQYTKLVSSGTFKTINQKYLFQCTKDISQQTNGLQYPLDFQWLIEQSILVCQQKMESLVNNGNIQQFKDIQNVLSKLIFLSFKINGEGEVEQNILLDNYMKYKQYLSLMKRLKQKAIGDAVKDQFIKNIYLNLLISVYPKELSQQLIESIQNKYQLYNSLINKNILIRKEYILRLIQQDITDVVDLQQQYIKYWKNNIQFFFGRGVDAITFKDISGIQNIFGFPGKITTYIRMKVNNFIVGKNLCGDKKVNFDWRDLGFLHLINPFLTSTDRHNIKQRSQSLSKNYPIIGGKDCQDIYDGEIQQDISPEDAEQQMNKELDIVSKTTSSLSGGGGAAAFYSSRQYVCDYQREKNNEWKWNCKATDDGTTTELYLESDLYKYFQTNENKYGWGDIEDVQKSGQKHLNKNGDQYYKYYHHGSDNREKRCKDDEDLRNKYYKLSGDFMNMYCFDTKKPIYFNSIYDFERGVLLFGSHGNKKEFINFATNKEDSKFTIVQNTVNSSNIDSYIEFYENYTKHTNNINSKPRYLAGIMKQLLLSKAYLESGYSLPRPGMEIQGLNEFYLCHDNEMKKCDGKIPFKGAIADGEEEKGFWSSMSNFAKSAINVFKIIPNTLKAIISIFKFILNLIKTIINNPGNIILKLFKIVLMIIWQLVSRVLGIFVAGFYVAFNLSMRLGIGLSYILGGFVFYSVILGTVFYTVAFNPISYYLMQMGLYIKQFDKLLDIKNPEAEYTKKYSQYNKGSSVCYGNYIPNKGFCVRDKYSWEIPQYSQNALILKLAENTNEFLNTQKLQLQTHKLFGKNSHKYIHNVIKTHKDRTMKKQEQEQSIEVQNYAQNTCKNLSHFENETLNQQCSDLLEQETPSTWNHNSNIKKDYENSLQQKDNNKTILKGVDPILLCAILFLAIFTILKTTNMKTMLFVKK